MIERTRMDRSRSVRSHAAAFDSASCYSFQHPCLQSPHSWRMNVLCSKVLKFNIPTQSCFTSLPTDAELFIHLGRARNQKQLADILGRVYARPPAGEAPFHPTSSGRDRQGIDSRRTDPTLLLSIFFPYSRCQAIRSRPRPKCRSTYHQTFEGSSE